MVSKKERSGEQGSASAEITIYKEPGTDYRKILALPGGGARARSSTEASERRDSLKITIRARDITALRASTNSIMRDLQVIAAVNRAGRLASRYSTKHRKGAKGKGI